MKFKPTVFALFASTCLAVSVQGQMVFYNFDDADGDTDTDTDARTADTIVSNLSVSLLATESGFNSALSGTFSDPPAIQVSGASGFFSDPTSQTAAEDAVFFTITAHSGFQFSISQISFEARSTSTAPPDIGFSVDTTLYDQSGSYSNNSTQTTISQSGLGYSNLTSATLAIQGWNSSGSGALQLDDIAVYGSVSSIPEPSTYVAIGGLLALGMVIIYRRHEQAVV